MRTDIISILPDASDKFTCNSVLNFRKYYDFIKDTLAKTTSFKKIFFEHILQQFDKNESLLVQTSHAELKSHADLLELIFHSLSKMVEDEEIKPWSLNLPMQPTVFYSTNAFHKLVSAFPVGAHSEQPGAVPLKGSQLEFVYSVLIEQYYGIPSPFSRDVVYEALDHDSELTRYYKAEIDTRFIEILPEKELPEFPIDLFQAGSQTIDEKLNLMRDALPIEMFRFEGFGITALKEVTIEYAVDNLQRLLLDHSMYSTANYFTDAVHWLKIITGNNNIEFGIVPALYMNEKLVYSERLYLNSMLIAVARRRGLKEISFLALIDKFFKSPKLQVFPEITEQEESGFLKLLFEDGIISYGVIPVYYGKIVVGVVEVYSRKSGLLNEKMLSRLDPVMPLLSQLLNNGISEFQDEINTVIQEKFTSLQPSVQWKFNEAAWHFVRDRNIDPRGAEIENIHFEDVYPLYGSIDIRNSTIERNVASNKDMHTQLQLLRILLEKIKCKGNNEELTILIQKLNNWIGEINDVHDFNRQIDLTQFLQSDVNPVLQKLKNTDVNTGKLVDEYLQIIENESSSIYENRRLLERSMQRIISAMNNYLDKMSEEIQQSYPAYFEKFRTDGVEYDIYIGQSMSPDQPFSEQHVRNLRILQLTSMASIVKFTSAISANLPVKVETTQLIFIHSQPIDIRFRNDEKRFDVEGAYNIRYQIVKKRIDKVLLKDSEERLTQPEKIALVYMNQQEATEYLGYIADLQSQGILADDLEELDLEELQGVSGLKALRIGISKEKEQPSVREAINKAIPVGDK